MPWPMVHFAISERLSLGEPSPELLIGSIAPDAVHVRGNITREEKGLTHLVHKGKLPNKAFIMETYRTYLSMRSEREWKDFVLGYFSHIYADLRWTEVVYAAFENNFTGNKEEIRETYNVEVSQVEFNLMRSLENSEKLLAILRLAKGYSIDPFLTHVEIECYRDRKINWLEEPINEPHIIPKYFQSDTISSFIRETSREFIELSKN